MAGKNKGRDVITLSMGALIERLRLSQGLSMDKLSPGLPLRLARMASCAHLLLMGLLATGVVSMMRAGACTIASGIDPQRQVWTANNEDGGAAQKYVTSLNVYTKEGSARYGYFMLIYDVPNYGIQGGMNEAGLTFDFNALQISGEVKDRAKKKRFPRSNDGIMHHILADMETVEEVVAFFDEYWFDQALSKWQIHVADRHGHFAIIGPSGSLIVKDRPYLVSTNFDIVGKEDGSGCWRYPIATHKLKTDGASLATMIDICKSTAQHKDGVTIYSNVQNLTTGDVWFFINGDFERPFKTNIRTLVAEGKKSYPMTHLHRESVFTPNR